MAIIQISKIQQRSGNIVDLPQLDEAEFGWASDAKRLFVGKSTPNENIEVLTSYSNISFSQITGSSGNLDVDSANLVNGQLLVYNGDNWTNRGHGVGGRIDLGDVSNVKIDGGAISYVLETDGTGNLSWTPKSTLVSAIHSINKANPAVVTTDEENFFTESTLLTITNVSGMTEVNGGSFYANILTSNTFSLYSDIGLTLPVDSTGFSSYTGNGRAISSVGGSGITAAGGTNTMVQFNNNNILDGDPDFTWDYLTNKLNVNGNVAAGNLSAIDSVTSDTFVSTIVTGTAPIHVISKTRVSNLSVEYSNVSDFNVVTLQSTGTYYLPLISGTSTGNFALNSNSTFSVNIANGSMIATEFVGKLFGNATTAGTVVTNAQPNITSVGTLSSLSVTSNANVGNLRTAGLITATGNITGGNIATSGLITVTGNITGANIITSGLITATGNITGANIITSGLITATGNITGANLITAGLITATGNITGANLITTGLITATGNITGSNFVTSGAITSVGNLTASNLITSGLVQANSNITGANLITAGLVTATGNIIGANFITAGLVTAVGNVISGNIVTSGLVTATGNVTGSNLISNGLITATGNISGANLNISGLITATGNITGGNLSVGTGSVTLQNITTGANTIPGTITGNFVLTTGSRLTATYADLAEYYSADQLYEPGTVLEFGGVNEVTLASDETRRVAGVVSTNPAYLMNSMCPGEFPVALALQGRVPCKVRGTIYKGDMLVSGGNGYARPSNNPMSGTVIGKALSDFTGTTGIVEIAVGRL